MRLYSDTKNVLLWLSIIEPEDNCYLKLKLVIRCLGIGTGMVSLDGRDHQIIIVYNAYKTNCLRNKLKFKNSSYVYCWWKNNHCYSSHDKTNPCIKFPHYISLIISFGMSSMIWYFSAHRKHLDLPRFAETT